MCVKVKIAHRVCQACSCRRSSDGCPLPWLFFPRSANCPSVACCMGKPRGDGSHQQRSPPPGIQGHGGVRHHMEGMYACICTPVVALHSVDALICFSRWQKEPVACVASFDRKGSLPTHCYRLLFFGGGAKVRQAFPRPCSVVSSFMRCLPVYVRRPVVQSATLDALHMVYPSLGLQIPSGPVGYVRVRTCETKNSSFPAPQPPPYPSLPSSLSLSAAAGARVLRGSV